MPPILSTRKLQQCTNKIRQTPAVTLAMEDYQLERMVNWPLLNTQF